jgi:hypothetical protein
MNMRSTILAVLLLVSPVYAEGVAQDSDGIPAVGATISLKPTNAGYEGDIVLPGGKYTAASVTSSDPLISRVLQQRVETQEEVVAPQAPHGEVGKPSNPPPAGQAEQGKALTSFAKLVTIVLSSGSIPQGQYRFTLKLSGAAPVTRDLTLSVPPSHIDALDTLIVVSEWAKPSLFGESKTANQPQIWETSQKGWLTHLTLDQKGQTDAGPDPGGRIKPKNANLPDIDPGKNALILLGRDYDLDGSFPLGTAKGKLVLKADQLTDPVTFNFEIRSRVWIAWLFVPMIIGLFLGYIARTSLANLLALSQERKKGYDLIALIDQALRENDDPAFQRAANTARDRALMAASKKKAVEIKDGIEAARTDFQTASNSLAQRRAELDQKIAALLAIAKAEYRLPNDLKEALQAARSAIDGGLAGSLVRNDVETAGADLDALRSNVREATCGAADRWVKATAALDSIIDSLGPSFGLSGLEDFQAKLKAVVDPIRTALAQLNSDTAGTIERTKMTLDALHSNIYALGQLRDSIADAIMHQLAGFEQKLNDKLLPKREGWSTWLAAARAFASTVTNFVPEAPDITPLARAVSPLANQLRNVLLDQLADGAVASGPTDALLKQNKIGDAVAKVAEAVVPPAAGAEGQLKGPAPSTVSKEVADEVTSQRTQTPIVVPAPPMVYATYPTAARPDASAIALFQARAERDIETAQGIFYSPTNGSARR